MEDLTSISNITETVVGVSVIVIVLLFLRYITARDKDTKEYIQQFNKTIQNHMEHENASFGEMTSAMKEMQAYFRGLNGTLKRRKK